MYLVRPDQLQQRTSVHLELEVNGGGGASPATADGYGRVDHGPVGDYGNSGEHGPCELRVVCLGGGGVATGASLQPQAWARWPACGRLAAPTGDKVSKPSHLPCFVTS